MWERIKLDFIFFSFFIGHYLTPRCAHICPLLRLRLSKIITYAIWQGGHVGDILDLRQREMVVSAIAQVITQNNIRTLEVLKGTGILRWTPLLGQDRSNIKVGSRYPQRVWC